jgi:uncharacterized cupin superfamily protein
MATKTISELIVDLDTAPVRTGTPYPDQFKHFGDGRIKHALGDAVGLTRYGVNLVHMPPGTASSARHWHARQDEFIYILEGEVVLVTNEGETVLGPGTAVGFPAGNANGHHLVNRTDSQVVLLEVGDRTPGDQVTYSDIDMLNTDVDGKRMFTRKDGTPF